MLKYRHVPFAVFRQQCGGVGEAGLKRYDIMNGEDGCLLYTSDAADDLLCVDLGGRRIIKKKKHK